VATPFTVATKERYPPSCTVAVRGLMATDTEDEGEGDEAEGVAGVEGFAHPVVRNSRPSERAKTILEDQRCFRNCDFMARIVFMELLQSRVFPCATTMPGPKVIEVYKLRRWTSDSAKC
jgi:hypothetical protein